MKLSDDVTIVIRDGKRSEAPSTSREGENEGVNFTLDQRRDMIGAALLAVDIMDVTIAVVKDSESDEDWAHHVLDAAGNPTEPIVWSGDEHVRRIFEAKGVATKKIVPVPGINGTEIRSWIKAKNPAWRAKVPAGALDIVDRY